MTTPSKLSHAEWCIRYRRLAEIAERIRKMRNDRARRLCAEAGLSPDLLGIHPHNAMCAFNAGQPWRGINYSKVRACLRVCASEFEPMDIVSRWDRRVRGY